MDKIHDKELDDPSEEESKLTQEEENSIELKINKKNKKEQNINKLKMN